MDTVGRSKLIDLSYILGISLVLSAIIYFFASNWPGFDRLTKIVLSVSLIALFYGLTIILSGFFVYRKLISELMLFTGCIAFGVGVGLLGQIYNSHADSYLLFLIWFIPAILFSMITKYQPFYVLSYLLFHLTVGFFLFPSSVFVHHSEGAVVLFLLTMAALNVLIFSVVEFGAVDSKALRYISFVVFHMLMIWLTMIDLFETYGFFLNFLYVPILVGSFYYFVKKRAQKNLVYLLGLATFSYMSLKFFELVIRYYSETLFLFALFFVMVIVAGNVYLVKRLRGLAKKEDEQKSLVWRKFLVGFTTALASVLATFSFVGFVTLIVQDFLPYFFLVVSVFFFILPMMFLKSINSTVRYTLLSIGYLLGVVVSWDIHFIFIIGFILLVGASWIIIANNGVRSFAYFIANLLGVLTFSFNGGEPEITFIILLFVNSILYVISFSVQDLYMKKILRWNSLVYALLSFFALTFVESYFEVMYYVYNALFFVLVTTFLFWASKEQKNYEFRVALIFWFAFLFYKYYDLVWKLVHKSIALLIIGILFIVVAVWLDRRNSMKIEGEPSILRMKLTVISLVILLQFAAMGVQIAKSEYVLATGEVIKLELQPLDPRSLIQGDYVILRYVISQPDIEENFSAREKVQLVLTLNKNGVYEYKGIYKYKGEFNTEYVSTANDVIINAKSDGWNGFVYGIESFFVPEGTGREVEREARFAYVKVASNGDAILLRLSSD